MRIGELARQAGVDVQTVRYYEREGLLPAPARERSGYRTYLARHLENLLFIRHCRSLDMPLADIREILALVNDRGVECSRVDEIVIVHLARVRRKLAALRELETGLERLRSLCEAGHRVADCGILKELIHAAHGEACACHPGKARGDRVISPAGSSASASPRRGACRPRS